MARPAGAQSDLPNMPKVTAPIVQDSLLEIAPHGVDRQATSAEKEAAPQRDALERLQGKLVRQIAFAGVPASRLDPLPGHLAQTEGAALSAERVKSSLRQLFATGLYENIEVEATNDREGVDLLFKGTPRTFIGTVSVSGARGATINTQLSRASQLSPGARLTPAKLNQAVEEMRQTLANNGYHEPQITHVLTAHREDQLADIAFTVSSGPLSRIGAVQVSGDAGIAPRSFATMPTCAAARTSIATRSTARCPESSSITGPRTVWKRRSNSSPSSTTRRPNDPTFALRPTGGQS